MNVSRHLRWGARRRAAFSLLELLVAVGLLSIVVLALYAMFDQTQKALHANIAQTDVMEGGRTGLDLIVRDIERARAAGVVGSVKSNLPAFNLAIRKLPLGKDATPGSRDAKHRDSTFNTLFYLVPGRDRYWSAAGLYVAEETNAAIFAPQISGANPIGTLYRYQAPSSVFLRTPTPTKDLSQLYFDFDGDGAGTGTAADQRRAQNSTRLIDGVVFFRVIPFAGAQNSGIPLDAATVPTTINYTNVTIARPLISTAGFVTGFTGPALPQSIEVEFGVLPPRALVQYRSLPDSLRKGYLDKHFAEILVFRQRIALRSALP